jgi:hypothetical protein
LRPSERCANTAGRKTAASNIVPAKVITPFLLIIYESSSGGHDFFRPEKRRDDFVSRREAPDCHDVRGEAFFRLDKPNSSSSMRQEKPPVVAGAFPARDGVIDNGWLLQCGKATVNSRRDRFHRQTGE